MEEDSVSCPQKDEDGMLCAFNLNSRFNFCPGCGSKVNLEWFQKGRYEYFQQYVVHLL